MFSVVAVESFGEWVQVNGSYEVQKMLASGTIVLEDKAKVRNNQTGEIKICRIADLKSTKSDANELQTPPVQAEQSERKNSGIVQALKVAKSKRQKAQQNGIIKALSSLNVFITPGILKNAWFLALLWHFLIALAIVLVPPIGYFLEEESKRMELPKAVASYLGGVPTAIFFFVLIPLLCFRVLCEYLLVLFRNTELLEQIRDHSAQ